jgi:glycosyltransferase involved in cell wall biosynthesis
VDDLIRALALAPAATHLLVIGDGPQRDHLRCQARDAHLDSRIHWLGWKRPEEIAPYLAAADVACLPSHMEGVPNAALEAFAYGPPVVACAVGGVPEIVTAATGCLVPPHNPVAFAQAVAEALGQAWDRSAILAHAARFDCNENARQLHHLLQTAAA